MLIQDIRILDSVQIIEESTKKGTMKIRGVFQRAEEANNNRRVYSRKLLEREIQKLEESIKGRRLLGELDHPDKDIVRLSNVSHIITSLTFKDNDVLGEAELLATPPGLVAQALIKAGVKIGISSRGLGTLTESETGIKTVNDDFSLLTFDLVADPSTRGAFPELCESTSCKVQEISTKVITQKRSEDIFITKLWNKLNEKYS